MHRRQVHVASKNQRKWIKNDDHQRIDEEEKWEISSVMQFTTHNKKRGKMMDEMDKVIRTRMC